MSIFELKIVKGKELMAKDSNGLSDPYLRVKWGHLHQGGHSVGKREIGCTDPLEETVNPDWGSDALFEIDIEKGLGAREIFIDCWDHDRIGSDDFLGRVKLRFSDFQTGTLKTDWYPLQPRKDKKTGKDKEEVTSGQLLIQCLRRDANRSMSGLAISSNVPNGTKPRQLSEDGDIGAPLAKQSSWKQRLALSPAPRRSDSSGPVLTKPPAKLTGRDSEPMLPTPLQPRSDPRSVPMEPKREETEDAAGSPPLLLPEAREWTPGNTKNVIIRDTKSRREAREEEEKGQPVVPTEEEADSDLKSRRSSFKMKKPKILSKIGSTSSSIFRSTGSGLKQLGGLKQVASFNPIKVVSGAGSALFMRPNESAHMRSENAKNQDLYPGLFRINVKEARNLPLTTDKALGITLDERKPSPQVRLQYGAQEHEGSTIKWSQNPVWDEFYLIDHNPSVTKPLKIDVFNNEPMKVDFIGRLQLDLSQYCTEIGSEAGDKEPVPIDLVLPLKPRTAHQKSEVSGELHLSIEGRTRQINDPTDMAAVVSLSVPPYGTYDVLLLVFIILFIIIWVM